MVTQQTLANFKGKTSKVGSENGTVKHPHPSATRSIAPTAPFGSVRVSNADSFGTIPITKNRNRSGN